MVSGIGHRGGRVGVIAVGFWASLVFHIERWYWSGITLEEDKTKQTSEEIRLTSSGASKFEWLVGYFYSDFSSVDDYFQIVPGAVPLLGTSNVLTQLQPVKIIQQAEFGELSYQLTPQLKATAASAPAIPTTDR